MLILILPLVVFSGAPDSHARYPFPLCINGAPQVGDPNGTLVKETFSVVEKPRGDRFTNVYPVVAIGLSRVRKCLLTVDVPSPVDGEIPFWLTYRMSEAGVDSVTTEPAQVESVTNCLRTGLAVLPAGDPLPAFAYKVKLQLTGPEAWCAYAWSPSPRIDF